MGMKVKIGLVLAAVLGFVVYISGSGENPEQTFSLPRFSVTAFKQKKAEYTGRKVIVMGFIKEGSVKQKGDTANFLLANEGQAVPVFYNGQDGLPDTFEEGNRALVEGSWQTGAGLFVADKITTKCASKYNTDS